MAVVQAMGKPPWVKTCAQWADHFIAMLGAVTMMRSTWCLTATIFPQGGGPDQPIIALPPYGSEEFATRVSVCSFVREHISRSTLPIFTNFCACYLWRHARSSSGCFLVRYAFPVLLITSYLHIMSHIEACQWISLQRVMSLRRAITPLLRRIGCVVFSRGTTAIATCKGCRPARAEPAVHHCLVFRSIL